MSDNSPLILNLVITPHRSMTRYSMRVLFIIIAVMFIPIGVMFFVMGAWPVLPFMGAEVLLLAIAFLVSFRRARLSEVVRLTRDFFSIERIDRRKKRVERTYWRFDPFGLSVLLSEKPDGSNRLTLAQSGREVTLAQFVGAEERAELAKLLEQGLKEARKPGYD